MPFFWSSYYYYIIGAIQIIFILHALRTGRQNWILLLIFLPFIGAVIYFIREVWPSLNSGSLNTASPLQSKKGNIKQLERNRRIADTDTNRLQLAAAYASHGHYEKAIALTKSCLTGIYANNTGMMLDVARYSYHAEHYAESLEWFSKVLALKNDRFDRPEDELLYAQTMDKNGDTEKAIIAYQQVIRVHHSMEARYCYGLLLRSQHKEAESIAQFQAIINDRDLHPKYVRRANAKWINAAKKALKECIQ